MQSGPKGLDDPIDGIDKLIGSIKDRGDLVQAIPWHQRTWQHRDGVTVCRIDNVPRSGQLHATAQDVSEGIRIVGTRYSLEPTEENLASVFTDGEFDLPQYLFLA